MPRHKSKIRAAPACRMRKHCQIVAGAFTPALVKHSKFFSFIDCLSVGVTGCSGTSNRRENSRSAAAEPTHGSHSLDGQVIIYEALVGGKLEAPTGRLTGTERYRL